MRREGPHEPEATLDVDARILKVLRHYERLGLSAELAYCATIYRCIRLRDRAFEIDAQDAPPRW
jgi:hypothetical protein